MQPIACIFVGNFPFLKPDSLSSTAQQQCGKRIIAVDGFKKKEKNLAVIFSP